MDDVSEGSGIGLVVHDGILRANPAGGTATAVTVTAATAGDAVDRSGVLAETRPSGGLLVIVGAEA